MDFPRYVFTSEGEEKCKLGSYGVAIVEDADEFEEALKSGYKEFVNDLFEKPKPKFKKSEPKKFKEVKKEAKEKPLIKEDDDF